jgi:heterotetrameric sarcosine oxidase gamma subunit
MSMAALAPLTRHLPVGRHGGASSAAGVTLTERAFPALAALAVRTDAASRFSERLAAGFGVAAPPVQAAAIASPITVIWTGPDQYLAIDDAHKETEHFDFARDLAAQLGDAASVTDVTGARAIIDIAGPQAPDVLAKLVPIDLDDAVFPPGAAAATLAGHLAVLLWRHADEPARYSIATPRSFAASLAHAVLDAATEFGCIVTDRH